MSAFGSVNRGVLTGGGKGWTGRKARKGRRAGGMRQGRTLSGPPLDPVLPHLAGQRVAMDAEGIGSPGQAALTAAQDAGNEPLLEFVNGVLELHAFVDHFF